MRRLTLFVYVLAIAISYTDSGRVFVAGISIPISALLMPFLGILIVFEQKTIISDRYLHKIRKTIFMLLWIMFSFFLFSILVSSFHDLELIDNFRLLGNILVGIIGFLFFSILIKNINELQNYLNIYVIAFTLVISFVLYKNLTASSNLYRLSTSEDYSPNLLAFSIIMPINMAVAQIYRNMKKLPVIFWIAVFAILSYSLLQSLSRAGWLVNLLGITIITFYYIYYRIISKKIVFILFFLFIIYIVLSSSNLVILRFLGTFGFTTNYASGNEVSALSNVSFSYRIDLYTTYIRELVENILFGIGFGNSLSIDSIEGKDLRAHNSFIYILSSSGIIVFSLMIAFLAYMAKLLLIITKNKNIRHYPVVPALISSYFAMIFHMVFGDFFVSYYFWLALGFHGALINAALRQEIRGNSLIQDSAAPKTVRPVPAKHARLYG